MVLRGQSETLGAFIKWSTSLGILFNKVLGSFSHFINYQKTTFYPSYHHFRIVIFFFSINLYLPTTTKNDKSCYCSKFNFRGRVKRFHAQIKYCVNIKSNSLNLQGRAFSTSSGHIPSLGTMGPITMGLVHSTWF